MRQTVVTSRVVNWTTLSLVIEVVQVWPPTRDSSALDLAFKTAGTGIGVLLAAWLSQPTTP